jgi:hypothetical protein
MVVPGMMRLHEPEDKILAWLQHCLGCEHVSLCSKEPILRDYIKVLYGS